MSEFDGRLKGRGAAASRGPLAGRGVLILVENLPVPFDRRVWQEAQALRDAGARVSVICPVGKGCEALRETIEGIEIYRHPLPVEARRARDYIREYSAALWRQLRLSFKVRREQGFDVVQACNPPDLLFLVALVHKLFGGRRFVFDHHDLSPELFESKFERRGPLHAAMRFFERMSFRCADASIATNETFKRIAVERGGMDPDRVFVVKSYPPIERFRRVAPDPELRAWKPVLAGYVGIMARQDGVDHLVRAMGRLRDLGRDDIGCVIIGEGPELDALRRLSAEMGLEDRIRFTGYLRGERLLSHLSALDIGVIPDPKSAFNDKLSMNKVFEYMMLGLPIVQYDLTQAGFEADGAALVARPCAPEAMADAIAALADDPERRRRMGALGRAKAEAEFRWENEAARLVEAYQAALDLPRGGVRSASAGKPLREAAE
ncbi:glycosyltransferase family 4 protein [Oceanicella actignis]|uniref:Glycosyltransferase involved in cell wall bisynthesis n=1 Tax=Oceanicella actignis TaxID=1189325 RepID=A0A1M7SWA6_9RHOB|nr:glycosyltransferase family 4 protein [Oceanicella actignis]SES73715.1 Glycosyltransferase involved in cell wall bisynthesis [Oceanicella actignis]SHN62742.1 Glycosyltransferase involved in cell wall bisynthesis [Oceanicella actignis]